MNAIFSYPLPSCSRAPNFTLTFELHVGVLSSLICSSYCPAFPIYPWQFALGGLSRKPPWPFPLLVAERHPLEASAVVSVPCLLLLPSTLNFNSIRGDLRSSPRSLLTTIWDQCTHPLPMTPPQLLLLLSDLCHCAAQLCFHRGGLETLQVLSKPLSTNANKNHLPTLLRGLPDFPIPGSDATHPLSSTYHLLLPVLVSPSTKHKFLFSMIDSPAQGLAQSHVC